MESFNTITSGGIDENLVDDGWTSTLQHLLGMKAKFKGSGMKNTEVLELADFSKMEQIRRRCEEVVEDKEVAEKLKPWYGQYCKRPTFSDEYLQTFNRWAGCLALRELHASPQQLIDLPFSFFTHSPNVTLVDTDGKGVQQITRNGIMANGVEYPVDLIVFATGFEYGATSPHTYEHRLGMQFIGRGGLHLSQKWHEGSSTLHGITTRGFPNVFFMQSLQSALPFNFCHLLSEQSDYVAWCIGEILKRGIATMEPGEEAENGYVDLIVRLAAVRSSFYKNCSGLRRVAFLGLGSKWRN